MNYINITVILYLITSQGNMGKLFSEWLLNEKSEKELFLFAFCGPDGTA